MNEYTNFSQTFSIRPPFNTHNGYPFLKKNRRPRALPKPFHFATYFIYYGSVRRYTTAKQPSSQQAAVPMWMIVVPSAEAAPRAVIPARPSPGRAQ